jgi:hypothetical protein
VPPHDDLPLDDVLVRSREHAHGFKVWLEHLRAQDPPFAQASVVYPDDMGEWQGAIYLLTASSEVWNAVGDDVLANTSIAPVIDELAQPHRAWSSSEDGVMQWAAHFWDVGRCPATFRTSSPSSTSAGGSPRATSTSGSPRVSRSSEANDDPDPSQRRHPRLLRSTRRTDPRVGPHRLRCAASRTPTRTGEATATPRAASTSSTAPGIATPAAPKAELSTQPGPAATPTEEQST